MLGVAILMIQKEFNLLQSVTYSVATALGFALALVLFAGIRERLDFEDVPKAFKGIPIALITAGILPWRLWDSPVWCDFRFVSGYFRTSLERGEWNVLQVLPIRSVFHDARNSLA